MSDHASPIDPDPSHSGPARDLEHPAELVIYGDFACPFCALAHRRATRRAERDSAPFEWRAIEHDPGVPTEGVLLDEKARAGFEAELTQIRELLTNDEADEQHVPTYRLNTARLNTLYASLPPERRHEFAQAAFDAYWRDGRNLNDAAELERFDATPTVEGEGQARQWQHEWESFERHIVPMMRLPDGKLSRGLGALLRLQ